LDNCYSAYDFHLPIKCHPLLRTATEKQWKIVSINQIVKWGKKDKNFKFALSLNQAEVFSWSFHRR